MLDSEIRNKLKSAYPKSTQWVKKVDTMHPEQAFAIYMRLQSQGKI